MPDNYEIEQAHWLNRLKMQALGIFVWMEKANRSYDMNGGLMTKLTLTAPYEGKPDWFVVVKGIGEDGREIVAFGSGRDPQAALADMQRQSEGRGLRWRNDKKWEPPGT